MAKAMNGKRKETGIPWHRTIVFKLMLLLLFTLLPTILLFWNLYHTFQQDTIRNVKETTFTRDQQIFESFYSKIEEAEFNAQDLYNEQSLYLLSDLWDQYDEHEKNEKIVQIQQNIQWYRFMEWFISDMSVYMIQRDLTIHYNYYAEMGEEDFEAVDSYFENPEKLLIDHGNVQLYVGALAQGNQRDQVRAVCRMTISAYKFQELMKQLCDDGMAKGVILIDGEVLMENIHNDAQLNAILEYYRSDDKESPGHTFEIQAGKQRYFCSKTGDFNHRIDLLACRSYDDVFQKTRKSFYLVPVMIAANIIVFILFLFYVKRYIKKPVSALGSAFRKVKGGGEEVLVAEHSKDEFNDLYAGFNEMSERLYHNIQENYVAQIQLQREQLKQLQAQINPHFLYNTLLFIKIRIKQGDLKGAERMTELLSEYFRFMNRNKRDIIPLKEELGCICTYMNIQTERFSNRFSFVMDPCPPRLENLPLPRLLLQPLVENAMKYGIENIEENGRIHMYFEEEGEKVSVVVEEEGISMTQEEVDELNARIQNPEETAEITSTININKRIKLFYGEEYELRYERTADGVLKATAELDGGKKVEKMEDPGGGR